MIITIMVIVYIDKFFSGKSPQPIDIAYLLGVFVGSVITYFVAIFVLKYNKSMFDMVGEFHTKFYIMKTNTPKFPATAIRDLRIRLLNEETSEYAIAETKNDMVNMAGELADIIYIACGTAHAYGIPLDKVFESVHTANMKKLGPNGQPLLRKDGKIQKPAGWKPANIEAILKQHGWEPPTS